MSAPILTVGLRYEQDVVQARQRARQISHFLGFDTQDQTRFGTCVSEIARNAYQYAGGGSVQFMLKITPPQALLVRVTDPGPGIRELATVLGGAYVSRTGMGIGIVGTRRLMDTFTIDTTLGGGTTVTFGKALPMAAPFVTNQGIDKLAQTLAATPPDGPHAEVQQQNQALIMALTLLETRQEELKAINQELEDTNRGIVAIYAEMEEKAGAFQRANELKTRFLSNMTHEFRTPLNSIQSLAEILLQRLDGELTEEQDKQVAMIHRAAGTLSELVNDLLDLAKVEAGKVTVRPGPFRITDLLSALRGMLRPLLQGNTAISLIFDEPGDLPDMVTDEGKVSQILRNFISNALKFTEHGEVRVSARPGPPGTIVFAVTDTGIGIAPAQHELIFEEFIQIESALQGRVKGTGLGLPLSRKLAELLGGSAGVTSQAGRGSTFSATIPIVYAGDGLSAETAGLPTLPAAPDPTRFPVLAIDDNPETLYAYEKFLQNTVYQLIPVRSLGDAHLALASFRPAVIMLDILLANENGWDLLKELQGDETRRQIPVIVASLVDNPLKAAAMGATVFVAKPVGRDQLLHTLQAVLHDQPRPKILLVDDDPGARARMRSLLAATRFEVIEAVDGAEGLRMIRAERPEMIISDLEMPGMGGMAMMEHLAEEPSLAGIPVILATGKALHEAEFDRLSRMATAVLSKDSLAGPGGSVRLRQALSKAWHASQESAPS